MPRRTPKELLEAARKVIQAQKARKKRHNPVQVVKQNNGPEQADTLNVRCVGQTEANQADRH